jgi:hypothetical protein
MSPEQTVRSILRTLWDARWHTYAELFEQVDQHDVLDRTIRTLIEDYGLEININTKSEMVYRLPK